MKSFFFIFLIASSQSLFSQDYLWSHHFDGYGSETCDKVLVDNNGNNYIFGTSGTLIFDLDPTIGIQNIDNSVGNGPSNNYKGLYLTKLDVNGNFIWGITFNTFSYFDKAIDISFGTDGNIFILYKSTYFESIFNQNVQCFGIKKISPNGNTLFTKNLTDLSYPNTNIFSLDASSLKVDNSDNLYICGFFQSRLKLDIANPSLDLNANGYKDSFLLKLDNSGNLVWARKLGVNFTNNHFEDIDISNDGNINMLLSKGDNQSLTQIGYRILKLSPTNGDIIWEKELNNQIPLKFHKNSSDEMIIIGKSPGNFSNPPIDVDPSSNSNIISCKYYILWLDSNGNFIDVKLYNANSLLDNISFKDITNDSYNNTFFFGYFRSSFDADPSSSNYILSHSCITPVTRESFCFKLNSNREFISAFKVGSTGSCANFYFNDLKVKDEELYFVGNFTHDADLDPSLNSVIYNSTNVTYSDGFVLKLGNCDTTPPIGDSNQYFCSNQNPTISDLTPNSGIIKWYSSSTSTVQLPSSTLLVDGTTYFAEKQTGSCAPSISRLEVTVHINQTPIAPQATSQVFCESENAKISDLIVNGQNIKWYDSLISSTPLTNNTFLANNTNYYASQTSNNCESDRVVITVTITSVNPPTLTSPQTFCFQDNATINEIVITGQNITWYDAQTGGNILASTTALQNGVTYYATQTINNCESDRIPVLINIQVTDIPIGYLAQTFCSDANSTLSDIVVSGTDIIWYDSFVGGSIIPSTTPLQNQTTYYCTQTINGCESWRKPINIQLINTLNAVDYQETLCDDLDDGSEILNLTNYNSNFIAVIGNTFSYYTTLNGAENQVPSDQINNASNYNLTIGTTTIFVRIDSQNGCHQVVELKLTLVSKPRILISDIMPICEGTSITINAGNGFDSYDWSTGATTQSIVVSQAGNYDVTVSENHNGINCTSTKSFTVVTSNAATVSEIITSDWTDNNNTISVLLTNSSVGNYLYSLDGINYQNSNVFYGLESGEHTVFVKDTNGCGISSKEIYLLMYPKYFTPNGDSYNDTWKIKFSHKEPNLKIAIFDRYGKLLQTMNSFEAWDGKWNGKDLPSDDYWFVVTRQNGKEFRGHFAMKR